MTATLEEIHLDPNILDRAIARRESLDILASGVVAATLVPKPDGSIERARTVMGERFAAPDGKFEMGDIMSRDERNSRG